MQQRFKIAPSIVQLSEGAPAKKVQLLRVGSFNYFDEEMEISPEILASMVKNFEAKIRGVDLAIDYAHNNHLEAAGWIRALSLENEGRELWAEVEWTPAAEKKLADKEFRYLSAEFAFALVDEETNAEHGPTLLGAGLTNRPFVKNMAPVIELNEGKGKYAMTLEEAKKKLEEMEKKMGEKDEEIEGLKAAQKKLAEEKELSERKAAEEKALAEKKSKFDRLLTEGKVVEAQRDAFMSGDAVKLAELAQNVKLFEVGSGATPPPSDSRTTDLSAEDAEAEVISLAEKMVTEKKVTLGEAMNAVLRANPKLHEAYAKKFA